MSGTTSHQSDGERISLHTAKSHNNRQTDTTRWRQSGADEKESPLHCSRNTRNSQQTTIQITKLTHCRTQAEPQEAIFHTADSVTHSASTHTYAYSTLREAIGPREALLTTRKYTQPCFHPLKDGYTWTTQHGTAPQEPDTRSDTPAMPQRERSSRKQQQTSPRHLVPRRRTSPSCANYARIYTPMLTPPTTNLMNEQQQLQQQHHPTATARRLTEGLCRQCAPHQVSKPRYAKRVWRCHKVQAARHKRLHFRQSVRHIPIGIVIPREGFQATYHCRMNLRPQREAIILPRNPLCRILEVGSVGAEQHNRIVSTLCKVAERQKEIEKERIRFHHSRQIAEAANSIIHLLAFSNTIRTIQ